MADPDVARKIDAWKDYENAEVVPGDESHVTMRCACGHSGDPEWVVTFDDEHPRDEWDPYTVCPRCGGM